jgi:hypothetical protein
MAHTPCARKARKVPGVFFPVCKRQQTNIPKHNALQFCVPDHGHWFPIDRTDVPSRRGDTTYRKCCFGHPTWRFPSKNDLPLYYALQQCGPPNSPDISPCDFIFWFPFALSSPPTVGLVFLCKVPRRRHTTFGGNTLDGWSASRRDLYLATHSTR